MREYECKNTPQVSFKQQVISFCNGSWKIGGMIADRVLRLFDQRFAHVSKVLPELIAIDEFKGNVGKEKFQTIIMDVKRIFDVLPDRLCITIEHYFKQYDVAKIQIVVIDLSKRYKD